MAYTAIVILDNNFLTHFTFDAPHDRAAAHDFAREMWDDESRRSPDLPEWGHPFARIVAIVPGYHEPFTTVGA